METKNVSAKRTGGRSALVFTAVRAAVEDLVRELGSEHITVPLVAERAGVNPTSIYRRWGDISTLLNDIATYRLDPARPLPNNGDLKEDLTDWAQEIVAHYRKPVNAALMRGGAAGAGDRETDCLRNRRSEAAIFLAREENGGLTTDDVIDHLIAPIVYRAIFLPWTLSDTTAETLVNHLFDCREQDSSL